MSGTNFNSKTESIGELLGNNRRERIVVPYFQRGYEWQKRQLEAFWKDLTQFQNEREAPKGTKLYFLGPIVTRHRPDEEIIDLLDGQQRLATATILLSVLRDVGNTCGIPAGISFAQETQTELIQKSAAGVYALQLGETDGNYFRETVQMENAAPPKPKLRTHRNIKAAREFFRAKVGQITDASNPNATLAYLRSLRQILRSDLVMASIPVETERDAFRIFETLNDRGLRLSVPDLLLNYLMREAKPETDRPRIRELWTQMVERMGRRDINRFLRHMWLSKYGDLKSKDLFTALKDQIEAAQISSLVFVQSCADECDLYVQLITFDELGDATKYVRSLLQGLNSQPSLPVLLSAKQTLPVADFVKLCQLLLVFVTRHSVLAHLDAAGLETVFYELAKSIRTRMASVQGQPAPKAEECMKYIKQALLKNAPSDPQIKSAIEKESLDPEHAGYVMTTIANHMQSPAKELKLVINEANLEHIFPRNPAANEWGGQANHELLDPYLWHIGNLTVLGQRINREAGNKEFAVKRAEYEKKSQLEITRQVAKQFQEWNEKSIVQRASTLTGPILEIWNFNNPTRV